MSTEPFIVDTSYPWYGWLLSSVAGGLIGVGAVAYWPLVIVGAVLFVVWWVLVASDWAFDRQYEKARLAEIERHRQLREVGPPVTDPPTP